VTVCGRLHRRRGRRSMESRTRALRPQRTGLSRLHAEYASMLGCVLRLAGNPKHRKPAAVLCLRASPTPQTLQCGTRMKNGPPRRAQTGEASLPHRVCVMWYIVSFHSLCEPHLPSYIHLYLMDFDGLPLGNLAAPCSGSTLSQATLHHCSTVLSTYERS